jgi:hypothetical protein
MFVAWCSPRGRYCTLGFRCRCRGYSCDFHFSYQTLLSVFFLFFSFLFFFYYCAFLDQESYQQQMQLQQRCVVRDVSFYSFCLVLSWEVYYHILIYHIRISGRKNISNYGPYFLPSLRIQIPCPAATLILVSISELESRPKNIETDMSIRSWFLYL